MKRTDLKAIEGLTDEQIDKIMGLHQNDAENWKAEKDSFKTQIQNYKNQIEKFDGIDLDDLKKQLNDWQSKYDADMLKKDKEFAKEKLFDKYSFSSKYAKKAVMSEFDEKNFEFKDGYFSGSDEFFQDLKKSDPNVFESGKQESGEKAKSSSGLDLTSNSRKNDPSGVEKYFKELNPDIKID